MLAAISITPLGVGEDVARPVAKAIRVLRASGLPCETNAMFTNIEGSWAEVMAALEAAVRAVAEEAPRVSVVVKLDYRPGTTGALVSKVAAVEALLSGAGEPSDPSPT